MVGMIYYAGMDVKTSVAYGKRCQSPRTGFVHLFQGEPGGDVIPVYENICFAAALIRQKHAAGVYEGVDLFERLMPFCRDGNFPVYLHDYPRCYNPLQPLRIAPLLRGILLDFSHVLPAPFRSRLEEFLASLIASAAKRHVDKPFTGIWERRLFALQDNDLEPFPLASSSDVFEELITAQIQGCTFKPDAIVHPKLSLYLGPCGAEAQEGYEPKRGGSPLEGIALAADQPLREIAPRFSSGWNLSAGDEEVLAFLKESHPGAEHIALRWVWQGRERLHSLALAGGVFHQELFRTEDGVEAVFDLAEGSDCNLYIDASPDTEMFIDGKKATVFGLGDTIEVRTPAKRLFLRFEGTGDFLGCLLRGNRPLQTLRRDYEAFDWQLVAKRLRESGRVRLRVAAVEPPLSSPA